MRLPSLAIVAFFLGSRVSAQLQSPAELIRHLTHQSERQEDLFSCGSLNKYGADNRALALALVKMGSPASTAIEDALDSILAGKSSPEAKFKMGWLLLAYARINGPSAYPRLHQLIGNVDLAHFALGIDNSIALAFGLTSCVSSFRAAAYPGEPPSREIPMRTIRCDRREEPRDALDQQSTSLRGEHFRRASGLSLCRSRTLVYLKRTSKNIRIRNQPSILSTRKYRPSS